MHVIPRKHFSILFEGIHIEPSLANVLKNIESMLLDTVIMTSRVMNKVSKNADNLDVN